MSTIDDIEFKIARLDLRSGEVLVAHEVIFDLPPRTCAGCTHWNIANPISLQGYLEAQCRQPKDDRDRVLKRASDYCSKWSGK